MTRERITGRLFPSSRGPFCLHLHIDSAGGVIHAADTRSARVNNLWIDFRARKEETNKQGVVGGGEGRAGQLQETNSDFTAALTK